MTSADKNIREKNIFGNFFLKMFQIIGLQAQDELAQTLPLRPGRKEMVVDPVGGFPGAQNAEK